MSAITAAELAKHTSRDDLWFSASGQVYNVTPFLDEHPGISMTDFWGPFPQLDKMQEITEPIIKYI